MQPYLRRFIPSSLLAIALLFTALVARTQVSEPNKVCLASTDECYASVEELRAAQLVTQRRARQAADHLPFDYHELIRALLLDYLKPPKDASATRRSRIFVQVFDKDLDADSIQVLARSGIKVSPAASPRPTRGEPLPTLPNAFYVTISSIKHLGKDGRYQVSFSFSCGPLCAGGFEYELQKVRNTWVVAERRSLWVS